MKEGPDSEECGDLDESIDNEEMVEEEMLEEIEGEVEEAEQEQEQEEEFYITDGESDDEEKKLGLYGMLFSKLNLINEFIL